MRNIVNFVCCVLAVNFSAILSFSYAMDSALLQKIKSEEQTAYIEIENGQEKEGLLRIIQLFREVSMDDVSAIGPLVGPFQLFCFTISKHNDLIFSGFQKSNSGSKEQLLQPEVYPSDRLLLLGAFCSRNPGDIMRSYSLYNNIQKFLDVKEIPGVVGEGLRLLVLPGDQEILHIKEVNNKELQQLFVESYVLLQLKEFESLIRSTEHSGYFVDTSSKALFDYVLIQEVPTKSKKTALTKTLNEWGITTEEIIDLSPGLKCIWMGLPTMDIKDLNENSFVLWSDMLKTSNDSRTRYILLNFLQFGKYLGNNTREQVRKALERICKEEGSINTAEGIYARCILTNWDRSEHRVKELSSRTKELLQAGPLPGVYSPRSLYDERKLAINLVCDYYIEYCWYDYAIELLEKMGDRPFNMEYELFKREPLCVCMNKIRERTALLRAHNNIEGLKQYYSDIAEHTPNEELKAKMLELVNDPLQKIVPRTKDNTPPPIIEIMTEKIFQKLEYKK